MAEAHHDSMNTEMHEPTRSGWRHTPLSRMPKGGQDGGKLGGVVAGLSRAYGFDLTTTRVAVAVGTVILPVVALVYVAAWILLPRTPAAAQPIETILRDRRRMPLLIVIGLALLMGSVGSLGSWFLFHGAPWGLVLIGLGVLVWVTSSRSHTAEPAGPTTSTTSSPPTPFGVGAFPPPTMGDTTITAQTSTIPYGAATVVPPVAVARRPRRPIGSIGVGIAALFTGLAAAGEAAGWWNATALWVIVTAIAIVMFSLLISTVVNRSWVLPVPFLLLGAVLLALSIAQPNLDGPTGQRTVLPASVVAAEQPQHLAAGQLTIDLRNVPATSADVAIDAEVGMGQLRVFVPTDARLVLAADIGAGQVQVAGLPVADGVRQHAERTIEALQQPATVTFTLDLRVGMGQISVVPVTSGS
jgi:phage shock protein PspC (stress-responsive transcriptional regulator)